jgi:2-(3-amino-3-carboxypropyl)histidine synthase
MGIGSASVGSIGCTQPSLRVVSTIQATVNSTVARASPRIAMYDLEEARLIEEIKRRSPCRILIQFPEGLKPFAARLAEKLEDTSQADIFVSGDQCYGACDLALLQMKQLQADLLIHVGHAEIPSAITRDDIIYVEARSDEKIEKPLAEALKLLKDEKKIGLAAAVQHLHLLNAAKETLERAGKVVRVGNASGRLRYPGQILGCDYGSTLSVASNVDAFVVIASGDFHALGVSLSTGKRTIVVDPYQQTARDATRLVDKILRQRYATILKFGEAKRIGVIVGLKSGQMNLAFARRMKTLLEESGKVCILIVSLELIPESLESLTDLYGFVEVACPRISVDDRGRYHKPLVNPDEALIAIGKRSWEDYGKHTEEAWDRAAATADAAAS